FVPVGPREPTTRIEEAPDRRVLLVTAKRFVELAGSEEVPHRGLLAQLGVNDGEIFHVLEDSRGDTWYCTKTGIAREHSGQIEKLGSHGRPGHAAYRAYEDTRGTVWFAKDEGLFRATRAGLEAVATGMQARSLLSDADGNLWVGTNDDGLYRFRERAARTFTTADGLPNNLIMTVIAAHDGSVWTGANCGGISRFDGTRFRTYNENDGLLNSCVWTLAEDSNRDLWVGTWGGGAFRYHNGRFIQYSTDRGMADEVVTSVVVARDGAVWFATREGLSRLANGQFRTFTTADGLSSRSIRRVFED